MQRGVDLLDNVTSFINETAKDENELINSLLIAQSSADVFKRHIWVSNQSFIDGEEQLIEAQTKLTKNDGQWSSQGNQPSNTSER